MLPIATETQLGAVKVQPGGALSVSPDGTLSVEGMPSAGMRYGTHYSLTISDYRQAQYVGQWLVLSDGVLSDNANNIATLRVAPSSSGGIAFPVSVDQVGVGSITFDQGQVKGTFSLTSTSLKSGSILTVEVPDLTELDRETQASGLVLIFVC